MSLKWVHLIFIICATGSAVFFGVWALQASRREQSAGLAAAALLAFLFAAGLAVYWFIFLRKAGKNKL